MYAGLISDLGSVRAIGDSGDPRFEFSTRYDMATVDVGASIACNGVCLTVIDKGEGWFAAQASRETLDKTTLGGWVKGVAVNLERSLKIGDDIGGHLVYGHVDGVATVVGIRRENDSRRFTFEAPQALAKFLAPKGSVVLDGVSLTVNEVEGARFGVNVIAHTQRKTTFGRLAPGGRVNMEVDMLARYVSRLLQKD